MHGGAEFLVLGDRLFQRLVEAHGFTAIAVESRTNCILPQMMQLIADEAR